MYIIDSLRHFLIPFFGSFIAITILDFIFKIKGQFAIAVAYRKKLPFGYSFLPFTKLLMMIVCSISGAEMIIHHSDGTDLYSIIFFILFCGFAVYLNIIYKKEMNKY